MSKVIDKRKLAKIEPSNFMKFYRELLGYKFTKNRQEVHKFQLYWHYGYRANNVWELLQCTNKHGIKVSVR